MHMHARTHTHAHIPSSAQPALLYIVPAILGCVFIHAWARGELKSLVRGWGGLGRALSCWVAAAGLAMGYPGRCWAWGAQHPQPCLAPAGAARCGSGCAGLRAPLPPLLRAQALAQPPLIYSLFIREHRHEQAAATHQQPHNCVLGRLLHSLAEYFMLTTRIPPAKARRLTPRPRPSTLRVRRAVQLLRGGGAAAQLRGR